MTLDTRMKLAAVCDARIQHAFELAVARGYPPRDIVVILLDAARSIWAGHGTFKGLVRTDVTVDGRTYTTCCAVAKRTDIVAWWGRIYRTSCAAIEADPDRRYTFVVGFDEPGAASLISAPLRGANDTEPIDEEGEHGG